MVTLAPPVSACRSTAEHSTAVNKIDAVMDEALPSQPPIEAQPLQETHRRAFQHAGAHAAFDIGAVPPLDDDGLYTRLQQQMAEQHTGPAQPR